MILIESAGLTDVGRKREQNEDAFLVNDDGRLYVVADGMGGHLAGEVASGIVIDTVRDFEKNGQDPDFYVPDETISEEANRLVACIRKANSEIHKKSHDQLECRGMGSTVAAILFDNSTLIAANVGDSPIYFIHNGEIELISVMHTVAAEQAAINPERLKLLPDKFLHMLSRAIGVNEDVRADVCEMPCSGGDAVLLCSDGLSNLVTPEEMLEIVGTHAPDAACKRFVDIANERGGDDNITVIVLKVLGDAGQQGLIMRLLSHLRETFTMYYRDLFI